VLVELLVLPDSRLLERCALQLRDLADYVPSECLVYLVRTGHGGDSRAGEQLYKLLAERVLRTLPPRTGGNGRSVSLTGSNITDEVFGQFMEMLAKDRAEYYERLDFFELRFDRALRMLRLDGKKKVWRKERHNTPFEIDGDTGELTPEFQKMVEKVEPFDLRQLERADYRARLGPAIESLPQLQRQIVEMARLGIPFHSENPDTMTMAKALGKSDKTIRNHHKMALLSLGAILKGET
jgi:hypothetical protein